MKGMEDLMQSAVKAAGRMQPPHVRRAADSVKYSSALNRDLVSRFRQAGVSLASSGLAPAGLGAVLVRTGESVVVTRLGTDLGHVSGADLVTVAAAEPVEGVDAAAVDRFAQSGTGAGVWAVPAALLALADAGLTLPDHGGLSAVVGTSAVDADPAGPGVWTFSLSGVLATDDGLEEAVVRLAAAERLADITMRGGRR